MSEADLQFLRAVELRLLRCTLSPAAPPVADPDAPPPPSPPPQPPPPPSGESSSLRSLIESLVAAIERGSYAEVLSSDAAHRVFPFADSWEFADTVDCARLFYGQVERCVSEFLHGGGRETFWLQCLESGKDEDGEGGEDDTMCRCVLVMCIAVAALLGFMQRNMTGPIEELSPFPLVFPKSRHDNTLKDGGEWDVWARSQLASDGSDVLGKFSLLQYIVYARILLSKSRNLLMEGGKSCQVENRSISWWLCRLTLLQQRILDDLSSSLYDFLQALSTETLHHFGSLDRVNSYWGSELCKGEALTVVSMAHLEAGIVAHAYGRVDSAGSVLLDFSAYWSH